MSREVESVPLELALLARAGGASSILGPGATLPRVPEDGFVAVVRVVGTSDGAVLVLLGAGDVDRETALAEAASIAEACFAISSSRFTNLVPRGGDSAAIEAALQSLARANALTIPPPSPARLEAVTTTLRQKHPSATFEVRVLGPNLSYHIADSREFRTGQRPGPIQHARSAALVSRSSSVRVATMSDPNEIEPKIQALFDELEAFARRPIRGSFFSDASGRLEPLQLLPTKRVGSCSFALAAHLLARGALPVEELRSVIDEGDIAAAAPLDLVLDGAEILAKGLGAGPGTASGRACFTHAEAAEFDRLGDPAILFVHEVTRDEADALRLVRGVVTVRGGLTGEAAIMSRALSKPCIASGATMTLAGGEVKTAEGRTIRLGDVISLDAKAGLVVSGNVARTLANLPAEVTAVLEALPSGGVFVRAAHGADLETAVNLGAGGVVLAKEDPSLREEAAIRGLVLFEGEAPRGSCARTEDGAWICDPDAVLSARLRASGPPGNDAKAAPGAVG